MKRLTKREREAVVEQWKLAGPELERFRHKEIKNWVYNWTTVDALLDAGDGFGRPHSTSELVEMQRWFIKSARQQGLLPSATIRGVGSRRR